MFGRGKERERQPKPEKEKNYKISWIVEENLALIHPNPNRKLLRKLTSGPDLGDFGDAFRELGQNYKIASITPVTSVGQSVHTTSEFWVVVDKKPTVSGQSNPIS